MNWFESKHQGFLFLSQQPRVGNVTELFVSQYGYERLVVHTEDELRESKEEELTLVHGPCYRPAFTFNRCIS